MKKTLVLVLAALLILGSASIASAADTASTPTLTTDPITLKVWESEGTEKDFILQAGAEFTKLYPNITIEYEPVGNVDADAKIALDGPAGVGPDVFTTAHDHMGAIAAAGSAAPVSNPADVTDHFAPGGVTAASYDGTIYGYPVSVETYALFYNTDLIKEAPKTWDDVINFCKTFNDPAQNKYGIVWETGNSYFDYMFLSAYGADLFGPGGDDPAQHMINSDQAIKGLTYFQGLRKQILDVNAADMTGDYCNAAFQSGNAAMYIVGPWKIADFKATAGLNFAITTLPAFPERTTPPTSFAGYRVMCVSAFSEHPAEAQALLSFLASKDMLTLRYQITSQIPCRKDITVDDAYSQGILAQGAYAKPMPSIPSMGQYWTSMGSAFGNIWNGNDVKTELDAAAAAVEAATATAAK